MFKYKIQDISGHSRDVTVTQNYRRWPFDMMAIGEYFVIAEGPTEYGLACSAARKFQKSITKFSCKVIRNKYGFFRHGIITRTD
jgi:hypothetical protein